MSQDDSPDNGKVSTNQQVKKSAQDVFTWWKERTSIRKEDSFGMVVYRIVFQIFGIILLTLASPMLLLALLISVLVAL